MPILKQIKDSAYQLKFLKELEKYFTKELISKVFKFAMVHNIYWDFEHNEGTFLASEPEKLKAI